MICALLIVSLFFLSSPLPLLYYFGLSVLLLMWLSGMVDAYVDDEVLMRSERWLTWQKLLAVLPVIVISVAVITLMMLWTWDFSATSERLVIRASIRTAPDIHIPDDSPDKTETDTGSGAQLSNSEFFSIQVASFKELERAETVYYALLSSGYTVRITRSTSADEVWHRVLVGKFGSEQKAISFMARLRERAGFSDMVIRSWPTEAEPANLP